MFTKTKPSRSSPAIGRYRLLAQLGAGVTSHVYLASSAASEDGRLFALKLLREHLSQRPDDLAQFLSEQKLAQKIRHKRVVSVYEIGNDRSRSYAALQYVRAEPLDRVLNETRQKPISDAALAHLFASVAEGVHAAHLSGKNILHRALCARNILLGFDGLPRLADCGLSSAVTDISEERFDVFQLGALMSLARDSYPPPLKETVMKALSRKPAWRQSSAAELAEELRAYAAPMDELDGAGELRDFMHERFAAKLEALLALERKVIAQMRALRDAEPVPLEIVVR
jgi:hypothetical protein